MSVPVTVTSTVWSLVTGSDAVAVRVMTVSPASDPAFKSALRSTTIGQTGSTEKVQSPGATVAAPVEFQLVVVDAIAFNKNCLHELYKASAVLYLKEEPVGVIAVKPEDKPEGIELLLLPILAKYMNDEGVRSVTALAL